MWEVWLTSWVAALFTKVSTAAKTTSRSKRDFTDNILNIVKWLFDASISIDKYIILMGLNPF